MGLDENLARLRRRIETELPAAGQDARSHFFGPERFSPVTEVAVRLLRILHAATGDVPDHLAFREQFLRLLSARRPGQLAMRLWGVPPLDAARIDALLAGRVLLAEAFAQVVLTAEEAQALAPETAVRLLYRLYLDRDPDPRGLEDWLAALRGGTPLALMAETFGRTEEAQQRMTGRALLVLEAQTGPLLALARGYRQMQDLELARIYDFARLLVLLSD